MEPITEPHPSSSNSNYAFITHSQETLPRNLPPSIDNATLARRRRRRTSAHDQAILEEEYRKCDRPDKAKRKEITDRVQMGEKEVQIWFQNKRQSARRKAKPLLPHEIIPNNSQYSGQAVSSSQYSSFDNSQSFSSSQSQVQTSFNSDVHRRASVSSEIDCPSLPLVGSFSSDVSASQGSGAYLGLSDADDEEIDDAHHQRYEPSSQSKRQKLSRNLPQSSPTSSPRQENGSSQKSQVSLTGNYDLPEPVMTTSAHQRLQDVLSSTPSQPTKFTSSRRTNPTTPHQPPRLLKRSSSIRLSTSLEGKATVVLDEEPSSPPPSQSLPTPKAIPSSVTLSSGPKRRIVDSKIWEFYCDNQAMIRSPGQPKMQPAEAKQALGLVRKKSSANLKLPSHETIDSPITQKKIENSHRKLIHSSPTKAKKNRKIISQKSSRPKPVSATPKKSHVSSKKMIDHDSFPMELSQESDKENRPPGAPVSPPPEPRRRIGVSGKGEVGGAKKNPERSHRKKKRHIGDTRKILGDNRIIPSHSMSASVFYDLPSSSQYLEEIDHEPIEEDEAAGSSQQSFYMDSSQDSIVSRLPPARIDEMECVENLLSLRGGTWR